MSDKTQDDKAKGTSASGSEIKDIPSSGKDIAGKDAENVKGGRMRSEPEVTKNDTSDMYA